MQEAAHPEANIIFGAVIDDALGDEVRVTVIAAGFDGGGPVKRGDDRGLGQIAGSHGRGQAQEQPRQPSYQQQQPRSVPPVPSQTQQPPRSSRSTSRSSSRPQQQPQPVQHAAAACARAGPSAAGAGGAPAAHRYLR